MSHATRIIKRDRVNLTGKRTLRVGMGGEEQQSDAEVRLVAQDDISAVIEVICPCGQRHQIVCDYAASAPAAIPADAPVEEAQPA
ncbi:MAG: hypothetical protein ACYS8X_02775 [Planctomycetota bacterium]|jgi:hypothetical protein